MSASDVLASPSGSHMSGSSKGNEQLYWRWWTPTVQLPLIPYYTGEINICMKSVLIFLNFQFLNRCFIYCMIIVCLLFTGTSAPPPTPGRPLRGQTLTAVRGSSRSWVMRGMSSTGNPRSLSAPHKPSSPSRKLGHRRSPPLSCFCRRYK